MTLRYYDSTLDAVVELDQKGLDELLFQGEIVGKALHGCSVLHKLARLVLQRKVDEKEFVEILRTLDHLVYEK